MEAEASIGSDANFANVGRYISKASIQAFDAAIPSSCVPGAQLGIPKIGGVRFDTEQRVVGSLTTIAGIVADLSTVLTSKHRYDRAVKIKNEAGAMFGHVNELLQQSIVDAMKLFPETVRCLE